MAADPSKCAVLYSATTHLAYSLSMLAITPLPPFAVADQPTLYAKSTNVANAAMHLRGRDPKNIADADVGKAELSVKTAQVMLDAIAVNLDNTFTKASVLAAVDTAATDVNVI